jgi:hypothetical protein
LGIKERNIYKKKTPQEFALHGEWGSKKSVKEIEDASPCL